jgi:hypothetical protein
MMLEHVRRGVEEKGVWAFLDMDGRYTLGMGYVYSGVSWMMGWRML